ncbi:CAP domain-containing protein [Streptomyces sp. NPDC047999]|uniref:CAP domain-containing protein n=1 Tax=Streptomyces sp. NPDC047999 TaxID=3365497 RepID=UPI003720B394
MGRHRKKRAGTPVRTGLLGASAAMAVGAVAVTTGLLPGGDTYTLGSSGKDTPAEIRTQGAPRLQPNGAAETRETSPSPSTASASPSASPSRSAASPSPSGSPSTSPSASTSPSPSAEKSGTASASAETSEPAQEKTAEKAPAPSKTKAADPAPTRQKAAPAPKPSAEPAAPGTSAPSEAAALAAAVFTFVNEERATVGCAPVTADAALSDLARAHSADMAARGFFDHTNPDGASPWDRAEKAGFTDLGAENIARGQADAGAVMNAWMQSEGHRANILNCDFTTMGVGIHEGDGGPWWTQNFGF